MIVYVGIRVVYQLVCCLCQDDSLCVYDVFTDFGNDGREGDSLMGLSSHVL